METQQNNTRTPQTQQEMPRPKKWHKGIIAIIVLGILTALVSLLYFAKQNKNNGLLESVVSHTAKKAEKIGEYTIPVDSSVKRLSFSVVFKPANRDKTYDLLSKTGGQGFYLQPSEISKFTDIEAATHGENLLIANGKFNSNFAQKIVIITPSGKTLTEDASSTLTSWSAGEVATIKNPETGNWKLSITVSGEFSVQATADTEVAIIDWDFVKLGGRPAHEGYFPIDKNPSIGAEQILQINLSEDSDKAELPTFQLIDEDGKPIDSPKFYAVTRGEFGEFAGVIKVPAQDFRIKIIGTDKQGLQYQRVLAQVIHPEQKPAPLTKQEIEDFIKSSEQAKSINENISSSQISNLHDELLSTSAGDPIGVKISYSVNFPQNMQNLGGPQAPSAEFGKYGVYLVPQKTVINPPLEGNTYKGGVTYNFTIEYLPFFIRNDGPAKSLCIWHVDAVSYVAQNSAKAKFKIIIPEVNYSGYTEQEYSPQIFYQSAIKEGAKDCVY